MDFASGPEDCPFYRLALQQRRAILRECTLGLTARQQTVLFLRYDRQQSISDIAEQFDVTPAAISQMLSDRIYPRLREELEKLGIEGPHDL